MPAPIGPARLYTTARTDTPFCVVFNDPLQREKSGRAKRIVRWFADRDAALTYQQATNQKILLEGTVGIHFDAHLRHDAINARQKLDAAGLLDTQLTELASAAIAAHQAGRPVASPVMPALAEFLQEKENVEGCAPATVTTLRNRLTKWLGESDITTLADLTREKMEALRTRPGVMAQSRRNDMAAVSVWCTWLLDKGRIAHHPLKGLRRPKLPPANKRTFTAQECGRLLDAARNYLDGRWLATTAVMLFTGCRPSELAQMRLIYGRPPMARIEGGKLRGRANRTVPLLPAAVAWLTLAGKPESVLPLHARARCTLAERAGVEWGPDITRHTYISHRLALVNDDARVAQEAGTSQEMIHRHYHSLKLPKEGKAWAELRPVK